MSSSSWPPALKAWVQQCMSKATASNKEAVSQELKTILFEAHRNGNVASTDWSKVELQCLKAQTLRTTHVPIPPRVIQVQPPPPANSYTSYPPPPIASSSSPQAVSKTSGAAKKRKRKVGEAAPVTTGKSFPSPSEFASQEEAEALARRANRFSQPQTSASDNGTSNGGGIGRWFEDDDDSPDLAVAGSLGARLGGFGDGVLVPGQVGKRRMKGKAGLGYGAEEVMEVDPNVLDWDKHTIRGTNTKLEKSYLRLTSEPSPADIRPLHVLQQTLQLLKQKWRENRNYSYALDQFKSMRQDLTVQRIKNDFTVEVYEIHARIALEAKDLGEYNQCQTMLRQLYELGIQGHPEEFLSYRIIYLLHTRNRSDMAALLAQLTPKEKTDPGVHHALQVHASLATSNYVRFFRLFNTAPGMSGYIMDHFVERERMAALGIMSKAYMTLPISHLTTILAFDSPLETHTFLEAHEAAVYISPTPPALPTANPNAWKPVKKVAPIPLEQRVWDCRKAAPACLRGAEKYRVVDLKGQVETGRV